MEHVVIYGAGNMGRAVFDLLHDRCKVIGFMDGNPTLRGSEISGIPVYHPLDIDAAKKLYGAVALVAMTVCPFAKMQKILTEFGFQRVVPAGDYVAALCAPVEVLNTWHLQSAPDVPLFSDEKSYFDYDAACQWFSQRTDKDCMLESSKYFPEFLIDQIAQCSVMLDTAALDGGYIKSFLKQNPAGQVYSYILTPQTLSLQLLKEKYQGHFVSFFECEAAEKDGMDSCQRIGLMRPFVNERAYCISTKKIDTTMKDTAFDYLRCYSMSKVLPILQGGARSISEYRPLIAVNIGHYQSDFLQVPSYMLNQCPNYKFYFRMHSYQGNDCILYAVPKKGYYNEVLCDAVLL